MARKLGVIFDMDGVLIDSYKPHLESWRQLARELGRDFTDEQFDATFGRTSREIIRILFDPDLDDAEVRRLDNRKEWLYRELVRGNVPAMPGALNAIQALHRAGFALAIGSSGPPDNVRLMIDELGLARWVTAWITGADVSRGKPDPQVFQLAAERLELPPPRCVVVEDAPVGIDAAHRAGSKAIGFASTHSSAALSAADRVIANMVELTPELVQALL